MDPHPLANLFKRSNYDEPIASEFCALDYLYQISLLQVAVQGLTNPLSRWLQGS